MAESSFSKVPLQPLAKLPVVSSTEVGGFFQASTVLEEAAQKNFNTNVENEAIRQGIVDGQQGEFNTELLYAPTFRGQAYTRAAQKSFLDTVELTATQKIQSIIQDNPTNSAEAKKRINGYLNGVVKGFPPQIRERLGQTFLLKNQIRANIGLNGIISRERKALANKAEVDALARDNQRSRDVVNNAEHIFDPDSKISLKSIAGVLEQRAQIESDYGAKITDPEGREIAAFNPAFRERALQQFDADTSNAAIKSAFNRSTNKAEFLRQFEANEIDLVLKDEQGRAVLDLRPNVRQKSALANYMNSQITRDKVKRNAELRAYQSLVKQDIDTLKKGGNLTDQHISEMKTRAHQLGDEGSFAKLSDWVSHNNDMHQMSVMTPSSLDALVAAERSAIENRRDAGEAISETDMEQLEAKEGLLQTMSTELNKDPLEWANRVGLVETSPIIPTAQETITVGGQEVRPQDLMNKRVAQAEAVGKHYGRPPVFLKDEEKTDFQKFLTDRNTSPDAKLSLLASLNGFGDRQDEVLAEIAPKAPGYMQVAGLMKQGSLTSNLTDAMEGFAIIQGGGNVDGFRVMRVDSPEAREAISLVLGSAYEESPETFRQVVNVAEAIYTARMFRKGKTDPSEFDNNVGEFGVALQEASGANFIQTPEGLKQFGGIALYHGKQAHVPSWMEAGEFQDFINNLTDQDWRDAGAGRPPIIQRPNGESEAVSIVKELKVHGDDIKLISIGDGQYLVSNEASGSSRIYAAQTDPLSKIGAAKNGWYVLDLSKIPSGRRTRAMQAAKLSFLRTPESSTREVPEDLAGVTTFPELPEKVGSVIDDQVEKTKQLVRDVTGPKAKEFVTKLVDKTTELSQEAKKIFENSLEALADLGRGEEDVNELIIDTEEKSRELKRNWSAFHKLPKSKKTKEREDELNRRTMVLHERMERIKQLLKERKK